jgi:membrane protein
MGAKLNLTERWSASVERFARTMQGWPWIDTARTLYERFREDRLGLTASSLTFTTLIALVPLVTVMLAVFSAFPMFAGFQLALEKYFVQNLVPPSIAQPVLKTLTQFAVKAGQLGTAGFVALVLTALALVLTIDRTLNAIWRVRERRAIAQRVLIYWAALTLGPLLVSVSLTLTTYALTNTTRTVRTISPLAELVLSAAEIALFALGVAALYRFVPNTHVRWRHALIGGLFVAIGVQAAKKVLTLYLASFASYDSVYGTFAVVPIFLLWLYVMWVIVLLGAVMAAYAPSLSMRMVRPPSQAGGRFALAVAVLRELERARKGPRRGLPLLEVARRMRTDPLLVEPVVEMLRGMNWVARVEGAKPDADADADQADAGEVDDDQRLVLLIDPDATSARALVERMLLAPSPSTASFARHARLDAMTVATLIE